MRQDMMEDECSGEMEESKPSNANQPRALTYDEKKAAEAAFRGEPFNAAWSVAAAKVYTGIQLAMDKRQPHADFDLIEASLVGR